MKKILIVQTNYPAFLKSFYSKYSNWNNYNYDKLMKLWENELFGTSGHYSKALNKLGWNAKEIIIDDRNSQSIWAKENGMVTNNLLDHLLKHLPFYVKTRIGITDKWIFDILLRQVKIFQPDVVYFHHLKLLGSNQIRELKKHSKLIVGQIASPLPKDKRVLKEFDLIISSFPHYVKMFKKMGINSQYLAWCAEKSIPQKIGKKNRKYNVSYVGAFTPHHSKGNKLLEYLATKIKVDFWGYSVNFLSPTSPIKKTYHGQAWGRKMYEIFAKSKIVVNRHIDVAENCANNLRMFEATVMGALLITDYKKNLNEFFKIGHEVVAYKDKKDLVKKVKYYLKHPEEAKRIARAGQKRTLKHHNYEIRMKELDRILKKYLK
jgi:hypothetical protein